ncbi:hypothetical protein LCGC14_1399320 [marine sediment metagenome]|uniref:Uncharacterized protein n=1 Tax=marine sediment metagenome TaxID=412755 RepID=A0A0F9JXU0_9ZZZZ
MGGKPGQSGRIVGFRSQPAGGASYTTIAYSATDNRVTCPHEGCKSQWFMVKNTKTIDDGYLPTWMDGYNGAGTKDMIIFLCSNGHEHGKQCAIAGDDWAAQ